MTAPVPANRFERRRHRNREALLASAIQLFQEHGVGAVRLEDICAEADVAPRTFFNHFPSREHLIAALAEQRATQFAALLDACREDPRPLPVRLSDLLTTAAHYLAERPAYRELVGEMLHVREDGRVQTTRAGLLGRATQRLVVDATERGEIRAPFESPVLADLLLGALTTALTNWTADPDYDLPRELDRSLAALFTLFDTPEASP